MERQFKQGMAAPDWEMDDYGWCAPLLTFVPCRKIASLGTSACQAGHACTYCIVGGEPCRRPTFFPAGKLRQLDREAVLQGKRALTMHSFVTVLADLSYPKAALAQLQDAACMLALEDGIRAALDEQPGEHAARSLSMLHEQLNATSHPEQVCGMRPCSPVSFELLGAVMGRQQLWLV